MLKTAQKIRIARFLSNVILSARRLCGWGSVVQVGRGGVHWKLDLREGIDVAIYLLGGFERSTLAVYRKIIAPGNIVLDIGANIGAHTLPLANLVGEEGVVYAFEPTQYAYSKLIENIRLNPALANRIHPHQTMLVSGSHTRLEPALYSSWPLENTADLHVQHKGRLKSTSGARTGVLDQLRNDLGIPRIDFIKIDVDGHEPSVLGGAYNTLKNFTPTIMMELAPYVFKESQREFNEMIGMLVALGYNFRSTRSESILPNDGRQLLKIIPDGASINMIASVQ
jgi:FkbM family methyltransferase